MRKNLSAKLTAEFLGALAIVWFGCGAAMIGHYFNQPALLANIPWIFGGTVAVMIYAVGHISGAHFNPAVTLAFAVVRRFPAGEVPAYWIAQCAGALVGATLVTAILPNAPFLGATVPAIAPAQALLCETVLTFFLMFVIIAVATDHRAVGIMAGAAIGLTVTIDAFVGGPLTGASMNPARSLAPILFTGKTDGWWIYILGPMIGASAAAALYERIRCSNGATDAAPSSRRQAKGCC